MWVLPPRPIPSALRACPTIPQGSGAAPGPPAMGATLGLPGWSSPGCRHLAVPGLASLPAPLESSLCSGHGGSCLQVSDSKVIIRGKKFMSLNTMPDYLPIYPVSHTWSCNCSYRLVCLYVPKLSIWSA